MHSFLHSLVSLSCSVTGNCVQSVSKGLKKVYKCPRPYNSKKSCSFRKTARFQAADNRTWTCTGLPPEPKSGASANSAISANVVHFVPDIRRWCTEMTLRVISRPLNSGFWHIHAKTPRGTGKCGQLYQYTWFHLIIKKTENPVFTKSSILSWSIRDSNPGQLD